MARDASGAALSTTRVLANDALLQRRDGWDWDGDPAAGGGQQLEDLWEVPAARPPVAPRGHELEASTRHGGRSGARRSGTRIHGRTSACVTQSATCDPCRTLSVAGTPQVTRPTSLATPNPHGLDATPVCRTDGRDLMTLGSITFRCRNHPPALVQRFHRPRRGPWSELSMQSPSAMAICTREASKCRATRQT